MPQREVLKAPEHRRARNGRENNNFLFFCASKDLKHQDQHAGISFEIVNPAAKCCLNFRTHVFHFRGLLLKRWAES